MPVKYFSPSLVPVKYSSPSLGTPTPTPTPAARFGGIEDPDTALQETTNGVLIAYGWTVGSDKVLFAESPYFDSLPSFANTMTNHVEIPFH